MREGRGKGKGRGGGGKWCLLGEGFLKRRRGGIKIFKKGGRGKGERREAEGAGERKEKEQVGGRRGSFERERTRSEERG